jgi:glycerol-3-phosphate O-acyltransferase
MTDESMSYLDALTEIKRLKEALNKIRAEIEKESNLESNRLHWGEAMGLNKAIDIIDKHIPELTEESDAEFMCKAMSKTINKSTDDRNFIGGF